MLDNFPAVFIHEEEGYSVIFPDLNWLSTCGETLDEALNMATECLAGYIYECRQMGEEVSKPTSINKIDVNNVARDLDIYSEDMEAFVNIISVDVDAYAKKYFEKSIKKTLTIPSWLNKAALEHNINFSQVLQEALLNKLKAK